MRSEEQLLREIVPETLASYRSKKVKKMISEIDEQIKDLQGDEDITQISSLLEERRKLDELRKAFSKELRRIII